MSKKCFNCGKELPNTHFSGLCKSCYETYKDDKEKMEYYEYRELIELDKEFTVKAFSDPMKQKYNIFKKKFGDLKIIYS